MQNYELHISFKDWIYITIIGVFFGFLLSILFYMSIPSLENSYTIIFCMMVSFLVSLFSALFITLSNKYVLPKVDKSFWYAVSFVFSFLSGALGFLVAFFTFKSKNPPIIQTIGLHYVEITLAIGLLTFLIGLILHQFISMKYRQEQTQSSMLQIKLDTLESELNPHFLFNALNSISELIYLDQKRAESATLNLAKLLRSAIDQKGLITLDNELQMVEHYLVLENIRFANKINFTINEYEPYKNDLLPKFSIQLLIENAIKHGFTGEPLDVEVHIQKDKISVCNNGKKSNEIKFGLGLNNLQKRLKFLKIGELSYDVSPNNMCFHITRR